MYQRLLFSTILCLFAAHVQAQPEPCGLDAAMTSQCIDACVVCDIDGFTGVNNLTAQGQGFSEFCTTQYNNMQYIAFIAGTEDLTIMVDVGNCSGGFNSLEVGFFESTDCESFTPITICDTDIEANQSQTFTSLVPLTIGQYYYLVIDGSGGSNCSWTFTVLEGSTEVLPLETSGELSHTETGCPDLPVTFSTTGEVGAADYRWTIDGDWVQNGLSQELEHTFLEDGTYDICVAASNVCDEAPPTCTTIEIITPETFIIDEVLCDGECVEANGVQFCETGSYTEIFTYPNGCDSIILIDIEVLPQPQVSLDVWICNDQTFPVGDSTYNVTGEYTTTVLTANNCDSLVFLDLLVIECEIIGTTEEIPVLCTGTATGTLIFSVDQGEPPLTFTYTNIEDATITGTGMTNLLVNNPIPNIPAGTYQIYISDDFGNDVVVLQTVTEPSILEINLTPSDYNGFNTSCFSSSGMPGDDGTLSATVSGGVPPYTYLWSDGQTLSTAVGLEATQYSVTATDANGCEIIDNFTLTAPPAITPTIDFQDPNCDGFDTGEISASTVSGGTPGYVYSLNNVDYQQDTLFTTLFEGNYNFYIMDANGCIEIVEGTLTAPDIPVLEFAEDVTICLGDSIQLNPLLNNVTLNSSIWTAANTLSCGDCFEPFARPFNTESYDLVVTTVDDCVDSASVLVNVVKKRRVFVPNAFSPNDDGVNDKLFPFGAVEVKEVLSFTVYNRWGGIVYEATNFPPNTSSFGWDGLFNGKEMNTAVFTWVANVLFLDDEELLYSGDVTLIK